MSASVAKAISTSAIRSLLHLHLVFGEADVERRGIGVGGSVAAAGDFHRSAATAGGDIPVLGEIGDRDHERGGVRELVALRGRGELRRDGLAVTFEEREIELTPAGF